MSVGLEGRVLIELRDTVTVDAAPEEVWSWLEALPEHALEWHPDHRGARWVRGDGFLPGAVLEVREDLHGKPHRLRMELTEVEPGRRVRYRILPGLGGEFMVDAAGGGTEFTAVITMGVRSPVVGPIVDRLLHWILKSRIEAIGRHQVEEGANLKRLLERPTPDSGLVGPLPPGVASRTQPRSTDERPSTGR